MCGYYLTREKNINFIKFEEDDQQKEQNTHKFDHDDLEQENSIF